MKTLERNKRVFWYANLEGKEEILLDGKRTGQFRTIYSDPVKAFANVSSAKGSTSDELFGINEGYDRTIVSDIVDIAINETSVLWIDNDPEAAPWDYVVVKVSKSINSVSIAIKRVPVQ